jgi:NADPH:quinone reductase-like Zn-dependent oxidoreductase
MSSNREQHMDAVVRQVAGTPAQALAFRSEPLPEPGPGAVLVEETLQE